MDITQLNLSLLAAVFIAFQWCKHC